MNAEIARMKARPDDRSSLPVLERLCSTNLHWFRGRPRADAMGILSLADVGLRITRYLARRFGSDREMATAACGAEAARRTGLRSLRAFTRDERRAWDRWSPLIMILPGIEAWSRAERQALVEVVRAKGARRESEFVVRFDRHAKLRRAVAALAREGGA
jgi:hypothetical protein